MMLLSKGIEMQANNQSSFSEEIALFKDHAGVLSASQAIKLGVHPSDLYAMRNAKLLDSLSLARYRLSSLPPLTEPDLVAVALKAPKGVLCLISALAFHGITTQIPHQVYLAVERQAAPVRLDNPPLRLFRFSGKAFNEGVEAHQVDGFPVRIYNPEKTLADCFKYRTNIGLDVALESLKLYRQ